MKKPFLNWLSILGQPDAKVVLWFGQRMVGKIIGNDCEKNPYSKRKIDYLVMLTNKGIERVEKVLIVEISIPYNENK